MARHDTTLLDKRRPDKTRLDTTRQRPDKMRHGTTREDKDRIDKTKTVLRISDGFTGISDGFLIGVFF